MNDNKGTIYLMTIVIVVACLWSLVAFAKTPWKEQLQKPTVCGNLYDVQNYYASMGFEPSIRSGTLDGFSIVIWMHKDYYNNERIKFIRVLEIDPSGKIACEIFSGDNVEFNSNFWGSMKLQPKGLQI